MCHHRKTLLPESYSHLPPVTTTSVSSFGKWNGGINISVGQASSVALSAASLSVKVTLLRSKLDSMMVPLVYTGDGRTNASTALVACTSSCSAVRSVDMVFFVMVRMRLSWSTSSILEEGSSACD